METIGVLTHCKTSEFQQAVFLNDPSLAYEILDQHLESGWYPENAQTDWTDIAVLDGKYFAVYGEDAVTASESSSIYIQIEPTENLKKEYDYFKEY